MADDGSAQSKTVWPLPAFRFKVTLGATDAQGGNFHEVSGLETEVGVIEYRHSTSKEFSTIKMPGIRKVGNVTLKRGVFTADNTFWNWFNQFKMNTIKRQTVIIQLLGEGDSPKAEMTWTLNNAFPTKITGVDMKSDGNDVAVQSIELAYETLVIKVG